jgi:hypothetical protein
LVAKVKIKTVDKVKGCVCAAAFGFPAAPVISKAEIAGFFDFRESAKRIVQLAASRVAVFPIERRVESDDVRGESDMVFDLFKFSRRNSKRDYAKRQNSGVLI